MLKYLIIADSKKIDYLEILKVFDLKRFAMIIDKNNLSEAEKGIYGAAFGALVLIDDWSDKLSIWNAALGLSVSGEITKIAALDEEDLLLAGALRERFNVEGMNYRQTAYFRDKLKMKELAKANDIAVPVFAEVNDFLDIYDFLDKHGYAAVLKPRDSHSSQGVRFIRSKRDADELIAAKPGHNAFSGMLIETVVSGRMFQVDGVMRDGKPILLWPSVSIHNWSDLNDGAIAGRYFIEPDDYLLESLRNYATHVAAAFPTPRDGVFQVEFFHDAKSDEFVLCEIAARVCGARGRETWSLSFDIDLVKESITGQLGLPGVGNDDYSETPRVLSGYFLLPVSPKKPPAELPFEALEYFIPEKPTTYGGLILFKAETKRECLEISQTVQSWHEGLAAE